MVRDKNGNFYGATSGGGTINDACSAGCGVVFKLTPDGTETILYAFAGGSDGSIPIGGVVRDNKGNLYGTSLHGGMTNNLCVGSTCGTAWMLAPDGTLSVLHSFTGGADGGNPFAGVILDKKGNLYGTTEQGGSETTNCGPYGCGTVFEISPEGKETVLYSFRGYQAKDGYNPSAGLTLDDSGNLYGTTFQGGRNSASEGTVFKLTPEGKETLLYSFNGSDGNGPVLENLIFDQTGNIYGTTDYQGPGGCGTAFMLSQKGTLTTLHAFTCGNDGGFVFGGLIRDKRGNLYGTASGYGANGYGTAYKITPTGTFAVLYAFAGGTDAASPYTGLLLNGGHLYGGSFKGGGSSACGDYGCGTVFILKK